MERSPSSSQDLPMAPRWQSELGRSSEPRLPILLPRAGSFVGHFTHAATPSSHGSRSHRVHLAWLRTPQGLKLLHDAKTWKLERVSRKWMLMTSGQRLNVSFVQTVEAPKGPRASVRNLEKAWMATGSERLGARNGISTEVRGRARRRVTQPARPPYLTGPRPQSP